jgi:Putative adhesin
MRSKWIDSVATGLALCLSAANPASAQQDFQWRGPLSVGQTIEIKGINGDLRATPSTSGEVEVTAARSARRSNPDEVRIEVVQHARGVTICAVYPTPSGGDPNRCQPGDGGRLNNKDNDTVVHFDVRVPDGIGFIGRTVNGGVSGESLHGDADARTVNGSIRLTTTGLAVAKTVNGSMNITMGRADWPDGASFKTVNGSITLTLPSALAAELRAEMLNGTLTSDFPVSVISSTANPRRLRGTIGSGTRPLDISTVNGSIRLLRAQ